MLTWSRLCDAETEARSFAATAVDRVELIFPGSLFTAGVEKHSEATDGGLFHLHVGVVRPVSKDVKVGRRLDLDGHHPNISVHARASRRDLETCLTYPVKEDETPIQNWEDLEADLDALEADGPSSTSTKPASMLSADKAFGEALDAASYDDAMKAIEKGAPKDFVLRHRDISEFFQRYFTPAAPPPKYTLDKFNVEGIDWSKVPLRASVIVVGDAELGKTHWALANFEHPYMVNETDKLRAFNPAVHTGIVFDDFGCSHWPVDAIKTLMDSEFERQIRCRYAIVSIPAGTRKIFCTNNLASLRPKDYDSLSDEDQKAIYSRQHVIHVTQRMFDDPMEESAPEAAPEGHTADAPAAFGSEEGNPFALYPGDI